MISGEAFVSVVHCFTERERRFPVIRDELASPGQVTRDLVISQVTTHSDGGINIAVVSECANGSY